MARFEPPSNDDHGAVDLDQQHMLGVAPTQLESAASASSDAAMSDQGADNDEVHLDRSRAGSVNSADNNNGDTFGA